MDAQLGKKPEPTVASLPPLEVTDKLASGFSIQLPVRVSYETINSELSKALLKNPMQFPETKGWIEFKKCSLEPYGAGILLAVDFKGGRGWLKSVNGTLYLTGKPHFDANKSLLTFTDLAFTAETNNEIINVAGWLATPQILSQLQKVSVVDLSSEIPKAKDQANAQIAKLKAGLPKEIKAKLEISTLKVDDLRFATEGASITIRGEGNMSAELQ